MASKARRRTSVCLTSIVLGIAAILASSDGVNGQQDGYYGKYIGKLKTLHHGVTGEVFAVDARTLHIRDFSYDGEGPAAFFYAGSSKNPGPSGFRINDEKGSTQPLKRYRNKHVTITLPDGKTLNNIKWFSVWCDEFAVNFGDVKIPKNLDHPRPQKIDPLNGVHQVSSDPIVIVDAQTLLIPNFSYDGEAPDAKFWVGRGNKPSPQGIRVPDENGKENPLRRYDRKTIVLTLPGDLTVFDIGHFGVWCEAFTVDFGHVRIPRGLNVPPSLKMLGVSPQKRPRSLELLPQQTQYQQLLYSPEQQLVQQHTLGEGAGFRRNIDSSSSFSQTGLNDNNRYNNFHDINNKPFPPLYHDQSSLHLSGSPNYNIQTENRQQKIQATTYKPTFDLQKLQHQQQQQYYQQQQQQQQPHQQQLYQQLQQQRYHEHQQQHQQPHQQQLYQQLQQQRYHEQQQQQQQQPHQQQLYQQLQQQRYHEQQQQQQQQQRNNQNKPLIQTNKQRDYDSAPSFEVLPSVIVHQDTRTVGQQTPNFQQRQYFGGQQQFQQQFSSSTNLQQHVQINKNGFSNRQFGISSEHHQGFPHPNQSKLNCEVLWDDLAFEVRWAVAGDSIVIQLVGKLEDREYMSFGLSGDDFHSKMIGGDVVVAWVDRDTFKGSAQDYYLESKSQCSGKRGSCPDNVLREGADSVSPLNAAIVNGYSIVTYQRSLHAQDEFDRPVFTNRSQPVIWAIGPLNSRNEVSYHSLANKEDLFINFGRAPKWNCPIPESDASNAQQHARSPVRVPAVQQLPPPDDSAATTAVSTRSRGRPQATPAPAPKTDAWEIPAIQCYEPEDGVFYAQMGPTGGKRGYPAITGHVGWGISWYINGLLIPEINVVRGKTYTFVVEGGIDPETPARYHPFYITDDPVGGYEHKTPEERANIRIFAGARQNRRGEVYPTGVGRLCNWTPDPNQPPADEFASFGAYQRTLTLECDQGEPGVVQWTPDDDTPDTVYYQCFTHRYLGWKINVLDSCDVQPEGSDPVPVHVEADLEEGDEEDDDVEGELQGRPSIQVATRVRPDFLPPGTKVEETQSYKYIPLNDFQQSAKTQQNLGNPEFPFSYELVASTTGAPATSDTSKKENYEEQRISASETDKPQAQPLIQNAPSYQQIYDNFESSVVLHPQRHNAKETISNDKAATSNAETIAAEATQKEKTDESEKQASQSSHLNLTVASESKINAQQATVRPTLTLVPGKQYHPYSTTLLPLNHNRPPGGRFPVHPQMMIQRPQQYTLPHFRRPVSLPPHRGFTRPPPPGVFRPQYHNQIATAASVQHNYIINPKKPIYRPISTHHTVRPVLPHQYNRPSVVKPYSLSRIPPSGTIPLQTSPAPIRHILMSIAPSTNASPLKLRKISTSPVTSTTTAASTSTSTSTTTTPLPTIIKSSAIKSSQPLPSDLVLTSAETNVGLPIAVNTGFNPHSVVVEGGFKPIISSKPSAAPVAEERSSIDEESEETAASDERRAGESDSSIKGSDSKEEELIKQSASEIIVAIDSSEPGKNPFEGQQPETFEPMFIPSPPDRNALRNGTKKVVVPVGIPEDLVPPATAGDFNHRLSNNRKSGSNHPFTMVRPRPNLVRRPLYPNNLVPPFRIPARGGSPTFRYQQAGGEESPVVVDETPMAAQRMDTYYLPPSDDSTGAGVVVTYDGKTVSSESSLTAPGDLSAVGVRSGGGTEELIRRTPQFGPYLGEIPPPIPDVIHPEDIPQLRKDTQHSSPAATFPDPPSIHSTQLHMAANYYQSNDEPTPDGSETDEITAPLTESKLNKVKKSSQKKVTSSRFDSEEIMSTVDDRWPFPTTLDGVKLTDVASEVTPSVSQGSTQQHSTTKEDTGMSTTTEEAKRTRERRSPHHEPGHIGDTHEHHDHEMHKEQQAATAQACSLVTMSSSIIIIMLSSVVYLW